MAMTKTADANGLVEMAWDPITRIVGSLGIYTKIDFGQGKVAECQSTSSIFRGYSIFMKGKDPRDAHFITSRICGICGDNHCVCSCYAQQMAYGVRPPNLGEWIVNLGEAAEYMFDHNIFQENLVGVDYCEKMVAETNPGVLEQANRTEAPHAADHGYKTIGDIMRSLNPFSGEFYREALQVSRYTREMFCLMEGRHVHPSTLYPGGVGTTATIQLFTDYITRLMRYVEFMKKVVPMHDDLFDFIYEAMPGYEMNGFRRTPARLLGGLPGPRRVQLRVQGHGRVGPGHVRHPRRGGRRQARHQLARRHQPRHPDPPRLVVLRRLGGARRCSWTGTRSGTRSTAGTRGTSTRTRSPQKRDFTDKYSWVMSPRWFDGTDHLALDTGGGPIARLWSTALSGLVNTDELKATGHSVEIHLPKTALKPEVTFEWKIPQWSNTIERNRARTYFQAYAAAAALHFARKALEEIRAGHTKTWQEFTVPDEAIGCGFTEAVRGVLSHHMVIKKGQDRQLPPVPADPVEREPHRQLRHARPLRGRRDEHARSSRRTRSTTSRASTSCGRSAASIRACPCGVHMYLGDGKVLRKEHSPTMLPSVEG